MIYNLADQGALDRAASYLASLSGKHKVCELREIKPTRTSRQNRYLHLIIGAYGMHFGYSLEEAKLEYKRINSETYVYKKNGHPFMRSSADLDEREMAKSIDKFHRVSAENGCPLPLAENEEWLSQIEKAMQENYYL